MIDNLYFPLALAVIMLRKNPLDLLEESGLVESNGYKALALSNN